ncbi:hypothetical protein Cni_G04537 [Canna indica]|uniref:2-(3-amino-3-carboxypropyl)histidine synthase subunit 1 n=1 Tax=Canna indica TaxID=4628 RepID=A0AAQ3Q426_9LILI|nr:hypothetical protein Cni_G04537 [Canna indica]
MEVVDPLLSALADEVLADKDLADELQLQEVLFLSLTQKRQPTYFGKRVIRIPDVAAADYRKRNTYEHIFSPPASVAKLRGNPGPSNSKPIAAAAEFDCNICMDTKCLAEDAFFNDACAHVFCKSCIRQYVAAKVGESATAIRCPDPACEEGALQVEACRPILDEEVYDRWGAALCEAALGTRVKFYCPYKDCSALVINGGGEEGGAARRAAECPHCRRIVCVQCKVPWHEGMSCEEFRKLGEDEREREDLMLRELASKKKWQRCPRCKIYVERIDGCLFMSCSVDFMDFSWREMKREEIIRMDKEQVSLSSSPSTGRCFCFPCLFLMLALVAAVLILFFVLKPKKPSFHLHAIQISSSDAASIKGSVNDSSAMVSLVFVAQNPNKIGIRYSSSELGLVYDSSSMGLIKVPTFFQPAHSTNVSVLIQVFFKAINIVELITEKLTESSSTASDFELFLDCEISAKLSDIAMSRVLTSSKTHKARPINPASAGFLGAARVVWSVNDLEQAILLILHEPSPPPRPTRQAMEADNNASSSSATAAPFSLSAIANANPNGSTDSSSKPKRAAPKRFVKSQIPESILSDPAVNAAAALLPSNYDFEVHKTLHRLASSGARRPALQLPDGLLMYALPLADIFLSAAATRVDDVLILADPTYGACCLDDFAASALSADLLVHYGHSCLVPVPSSRLPVLYVFVDIRIDTDRLVDAICSTFPLSSKLALAGTIQFVAAVHAAKSRLSAEGYDVTVPQAKPLSPGEVLGCTAPTIPKSKGINALVFVADGRFHLEAFMIANPGIPAFRYDPFLGVLVLEEYDHEGMKRARKDAILTAREAKSWGIVLGTLGRQGNTRVLDRVVEHMEEKGMEWTVVLMSELSPARIALFGDSVDAWVQIACPRLSIDWGEGFTKPLLTTFELDIALGYVPGWWEKEKTRVSVNSDGEQITGKEESCSASSNCQANSSGCNRKSDAETDYPMDYYAQDGGDWNSSYVKKKPYTNVTKLQGQQFEMKT